MARARGDPHASRRSRASSRCSPAMGVRDVRLTGGEPLVRRDLPALAAMLARCRRRGRRADDQRLPARARRRGARRGRDPPLQRLDRLAPARPLLRDDPPRRAAAGAARARDAGRAAPSALRSRSTPSRSAASPRRRCSRSPGSRGAAPYEVRFIECMPLDADHAWTPEQVLTGEEIRALIDADLPARARGRPAERDGADLPVRRRAGADRVHQPGLGAVLRRLRPDPPDRRGQAAHLPVLPPRDRPARRRCARARATTSSRRSSAPRSGARS